MLLLKLRLFYETLAKVFPARVARFPSLLTSLRHQSLLPPRLRFLVSPPVPVYVKTVRVVLLRPSRPRHVLSLKWCRKLSLSLPPPVLDSCCFLLLILGPSLVLWWGFLALVKAFALTSMSVKTSCAHVLQSLLVVWPACPLNSWHTSCISKRVRGAPFPVRGFAPG